MEIVSNFVVQHEKMNMRHHSCSNSKETCTCGFHQRNEIHTTIGKIKTIELIMQKKKGRRIN